MRKPYLTLVYQIEDGMKRLLWVARDRTEQSLRGFFQYLSDAERQTIRFVCSDMCQAYLNVIAEQLGQAIHVLDRFHIMKKMNEAALKKAGAIAVVKFGKGVQVVIGTLSDNIESEMRRQMKR